MDDSPTNIGVIDSETLQEEFGDDVDSETLQRLMQVWLKKIHLKSAEFNAFSEIMLAKMEVHLAMKELKVSIFKKNTRNNRGSSSDLRPSNCFRQKQTTLDKSRSEENSTACTTPRGRSNLHTLDKSSTRVTKRKTRNNYQTNKQVRLTARSYQEPCISSTVQPTQESSSNGIFASENFLHLDSLQNLQKSINDMRARIKRLNETIDSLKQSQRSEDDNATADDSITTTRSADDSDVHMKTLADIADLETDNFNGHTEPNVNNIAFPVIQTKQPVNSYISNFDNLPPTFANAQANINLIDQHSIPNAGNTIQDLNNNNPNVTSYNLTRDNFSSDLNPTCAQVHQHNFNVTADAVQPNSNHTFYAQNYVNTRGNNNTVCSVIPCNIPPICAPRVNASYTSAVESCIYPIENCVSQGLHSIPTEVNNNNCLTANFQQFKSQDIFDGPSSNSSRTVIRDQLNKSHETIRNNIICNAISNQQSNDNQRNIQTETGTQKETASTIAPTSNVISKSTLTSNFALNSVSSISYEELSSKSSTDSNQLIINEDPIDSAEAMPENITQDLIKIWDDFSPGKKAVILKSSQAMSKSQNETQSNDKTALNCRNNTQYQRNLQSEFNLESQTNLESQSYLQFKSYLKSQSSLESQSTEPSTNNSIPEINIKKRRGSLLLEALKVKETANTNDKNCQKNDATPSSRRHSKGVRRNVKDSKEPLTDCKSKKNSTNKESLASVIVVKSKSPTKAESKSLMQNSAQRKESSPKADTVAKKDTNEKCTLTTKPTGNNVNFKEGDTDKSSKENHEKKSSKHRNKSRSSKRKKTDDDRNGKEKPDNSKRMDVRKKDLYERQNSNSNSTVTSASNQHQAGPRSYYRYINDYDWPTIDESYNLHQKGDVRSNNMDITYSQVNYNDKIPDWPYDTTTNFRRNKDQVSEKRRAKNPTIPEKKVSIPDPKQPSSSKATGKTDVTDTLNKKGTTLNKSSSKPAKQPKKHVGHTSKSQTPSKKTSRLNTVTKTTNNVETTENSANGKKSPVYVFRDGTFCGVYHTENPTSPDPEATEMVERQCALKSVNYLGITSDVTSTNNTERTTSTTKSENNTSLSKSVREPQTMSPSIRRTSDKFNLEKFAQNLRKLVNPHKESRPDVQEESRGNKQHKELASDISSAITNTKSATK